MDKGWEFGNANVVGEDRRGWLVGHFIDNPPGLRTSDDVEIKWAHHAAGEERESWVTGEHRTTIFFLIDGRFRLELRDESLLLERQGDYVMWGPGVDHRWLAEEDSAVLTVRWPSSPNKRPPQQASPGVQG